MLDFSSFKCKTIGRIVRPEMSENRRSWAPSLAEFELSAGLFGSNGRPHRIQLKRLLIERSESYQMIRNTPPPEPCTCRRKPPAPRGLKSRLKEKAKWRHIPRPRRRTSWSIHSLECRPVRTQFVSPVNRRRRPLSHTRGPQNERPPSSLFFSFEKKKNLMKIKLVCAL